MSPISRRWIRSSRAYFLALVALLAFGLPIGSGNLAYAADWVKPVNGTLGQRFSDWHRGVDIMAAKWTPIYAVHAGVVQQAKCDPSTGNCDVDGSRWVRGCGWYVGINHPDGTGTLYCHMVRRPLVNVGNTVSTGQVIGYVGSSGNSSGPHLHFQTHNGPSNNDGNTVDPVPFMAARGVNLGGGGTPGIYWVDTFANAPGRSSPGGRRTGTLYAGRNYVYCKAWGPIVQVGSDYNHWWLKTDLDTGNPWQNQWVSAYYLTRWGNDQAKDNNGTDIPNC